MKELIRIQGCYEDEDEDRDYFTDEDCDWLVIERGGSGDIPQYKKDKYVDTINIFENTILYTRPFDCNPIYLEKPYHEMFSCPKDIIDFLIKLGIIGDCKYTIDE